MNKKILKNICIVLLLIMIIGTIYCSSLFFRSSGKIIVKSDEVELPTKHSYYHHYPLDNYFNSTSETQAKLIIEKYQNNRIYRKINTIEFEQRFKNLFKTIICTQNGKFVNPILRLKYQFNDDETAGKVGII
jgi:hypothetical protein